MSSSICSCCRRFFVDYQGRRRTRCGSCNTKIRRFRAKLAAIAILGGKCKKCGFSGHPSAFEFHHTDPTQKDFELGMVSNKSWKSIVEEIKKCVLLCSNCHKEEHCERYDPTFVAAALEYKGRETFDGFFEIAIKMGVLDKF